MDAQPPTILTPQGQPARNTSSACPQCGAGKDRRRPSGGFGTQVHDVCGRCGYEFEERTR